MGTIVFIGIFVIAFSAAMFILAIGPAWIEWKEDLAVKRASRKYADRFGGKRWTVR